MANKENYPSHHPGEFKVDCYGVPKLKFDFSVTLLIVQINSNNK